NVPHVTRHRRGQVARDQQVPLANRVQLMLEGIPLLPHSEDTDRYSRHQDEGQEQEMVHAQTKPAPANNTTEGTRPYSFGRCPGGAIDRQSSITHQSRLSM